MLRNANINLKDIIAHSQIKILKLNKAFPALIYKQFISQALHSRIIQDWNYCKVFHGISHPPDVKGQGQGNVPCLAGSRAPLVGSSHVSVNGMRGHTQRPAAALHRPRFTGDSVQAGYPRGLAFRALAMKCEGALPPGVQTETRAATPGNCQGSVSPSTGGAAAQGALGEERAHEAAGSRAPGEVRA